MTSAADLVISQPLPKASSNPEGLNKMINQFNRACSNIYDTLMAASKDEIDVEGEGISLE